MEEFIDHIAKTCGLDAGTARKAIGIIINFVSHEGADADVGKVLDGLPGARELAAEASGASGGLSQGAKGAPVKELQTKLMASGATAS